jgi:hypothetical protein
MATRRGFRAAGKLPSAAPTFGGKSMSSLPIFRTTNHSSYSLEFPRKIHYTEGKLRNGTWRSMQPNIINRDQHTVSRKHMSQEVLKVLYRLHHPGHMAYLLGGGV